MSASNTQNDFSKGSIVKNIMNLAIPMTLAQLINVLYNIVDRIYIGRIPDHATLSLTGIGLSLPIITLVIAFANLFGMGGAPLCSIERGRGDIKEAEAIMVILLTAKPETILERVKENHDRPLLENNKTVEYVSEQMLLKFVATVKKSSCKKSMKNFNSFRRIFHLTIYSHSFSMPILHVLFFSQKHHHCNSQYQQHNSY